MMFKSRKTLIIVAVVAILVIAGGTYGGLTYAARKRAAFSRDFTQTIFGTVPLAYATDSTALSNDQIDRILTILRPLTLDDTISPKRAHDILAEVQGILTPEQLTALKNTTQRNPLGFMRGGGRGTGGMGGTGGTGGNTGGTGGNTGGTGGTGGWTPPPGGFGQGGAGTGTPGAGFGGGNRQVRNRLQNMQLTGRMFTQVVNALEDKLNGATTPFRNQNNTNNGTNGGNTGTTTP
ncbi:MAG: hypothetical protein ACYC6I_07730 [Bacillota bacterium]